MPVTDTDRVVDQRKIDRLKQKIAPGNETIILYTGTMEAYQGIDLLLD